MKETSRMRLAKACVAHCPPVYDFYVSVFGGSIAEWISLPPSWGNRMHTWNDCGSRLWNVFRVLQNDSHRYQLIARLGETSDCRSQYKRCLDLIDHLDTDPVTRAWAVLVLDSADGKCEHDPTNPALTVMQWVDRFKNVKLERRDWRKCFDYYNQCPNGYFTHFQIEPIGLSIAEHAELLRKLHGIRGTAMVVCNDHHWLYEETLWEWRKLTITNLGRTIYMNYELNGNRPDPITITKRFIEIVGGLDEAKRCIKVVGEFRKIQRTPDSNERSNVNVRNS